MGRLLVLAAAPAAALLVLASAQGGAFSGDNGLIAFTCHSGADVCTVAADGSGERTLLANSSDPSWSDDGSTIAFVSPSDGVDVARADGTGVGQLGSGVAAAQPSFSADGLRVAYTRLGDLYSILARGTGQEVHLTTSGQDADPQYSPDGSTIAFARNDGASGYDIWTLDVSSGTTTQLTGGSGNERSPTWSPTGLTIVYTGSNGHLFAVSPFGGAQTDLGVTGTDPAYAPDGTKIVFADGGVLKTMVAQPNGAVTTIPNTAGGVQPDWQPVTPGGGPPPSTTGAPANLAYPTITLAGGDSSPVVGHLLLAGIGSWSGAFPISYSYQWKRCEAADPVNGPCFDIPGATSSSYRPVAADYGMRLRVAVTATNAGGSGVQNSEVTASVAALTVQVTSTPAIVPEATPQVGSTLTLTAGAWSGSTPISFAYSWRRCDPVGDLPTCVAIPGATESSYVPTLPDIGYSLRAWITGTNLAGSDVAITNHTYPVVDKPHLAPSVATPPSIGGTPLPGRQLTANVGTYDGDSPIATPFRWYRCDATGAACHAIPGASKVTYFPGTDDVGFTLRLYVFAANTYGKLLAVSDPTDAVAATPPHVRGRRIVGTRRGDYLAGGGHDDVLIGLSGNDTLLGGAGDDRIFGGPGNDVITGGAGADRIEAGSGSDTVLAADGERDVVDCGAGNDRAVVDAVDVVRRCEVVVKRSAPAPTP